MLRPSILALAMLTSLPAFGQSVAPVQAPPPPSISLPSPAQLSTPAPTLDDVMTLGRPPAVPTSTAPPVVQRPPTGGSPSAPPSTTPGTVPAQVPVPLPDTLSGSARVHDGNTVVMSGMVIMLDGVDAPELGQVCLDLSGAPWRCGEKSRARLAELAHGGSVRCTPVSAISGGYTGVCRIGRDDLAAIMVREGLAIVPEGSGQYLTEQAAARSSQRGVWSGSFEKPWVLRARM